MPNTEARVFRSIWDDQDFLALPMDAKTFFLTVLTGHGVNQAGIVMIPRREWLNLHPDEDAAERLRIGRKQCEEAKFLHIDEDTDEVLIRSYVRRDVGVTGPPATFRAAMDAVCGVRSARLREVLRGELRRLDVSKIEAKKAETSHREAPIAAYRRALAALGEPDVDVASSSLPPGLWGSAADPLAGSGASSAPSSGPSSASSSAASRADGIKQSNECPPFDPISPSSAPTSAPTTGDGDGDGDGVSTSVGGPVGGSRAHARAHAREAPTPTESAISDRLRALYADPDNDAPCRRHPDDDRACRRCGAINRRHPDGYDPRPPELIPDHQLDVDAWADPALVIAAPDEVELGDPAARQAWYRQAGIDQLAARRTQARTRLAAYQARHPA